VRSHTTPTGWEVTLHPLGEKTHYTHWVRSHTTPTWHAPKINLILHSTTAAFACQCSLTTMSGNNHQSLVCSGQQCETMWRETWQWGCIAQLLLMNCKVPTWMGATCCALLDNSQVPHPPKRFFSVLNVPPITVLVTKMWCSGQRKIPISGMSWNIIHWTQWHQIIWLDLTVSIDLRK
jgi:hypothetical protein